MPHPQLYMVRYSTDGSEFLSNLVDVKTLSRPATEADLTPENVAEYLDYDAEHDNMHDFVGIHEYLSGVLHDLAGPSVTGKIMRRLLDDGGLHKVR